MKYFAVLGGEQREFTFERTPLGLVAHSGQIVHRLDLSLVGDGATFSLLVDGKSYDVVADVQQQSVTLQLLGERYQVHVEDERERAAAAVVGQQKSGKRELRAAMPGIVVDVRVAEGDQVEEGAVLVVLEAMKMQNPLTADAAGRVTNVLCKKGETVAAGALLLVLE